VSWRDRILETILTCSMNQFDLVRKHNQLIITRKSSLSPSDFRRCVRMPGLTIFVACVTLYAISTKPQLMTCYSAEDAIDVTAILLPLVCRRESWKLRAILARMVSLESYLGLNADIFLGKSISISPSVTHLTCGPTTNTLILCFRKP